jgi:hypothetical protein
MRGHVPHAFDPEGEEKLWAESSKLVGVPECTIESLNLTNDSHGE